MSWTPTGIEPMEQERERDAVSDLQQHSDSSHTSINFFHFKSCMYPVEIMTYMVFQYPSRFVIYSILHFCTLVALTELATWKVPWLVVLDFGGFGVMEKNFIVCLCKMDVVCCCRWMKRLIAMDLPQTYNQSWSPVALELEWRLTLAATCQCRVLTLSATNSPTLRTRATSMFTEQCSDGDPDRHLALC